MQKHETLLQVSGCEVLHRIVHLAGKDVADRALIFCWHFRCVTLTWFAEFLETAHAIADTRVLWFCGDSSLSRMRANLISVLTAQLGLPQPMLSPQCTSLSLLSTLDGFCMADCSQELIGTFFTLWGRVLLSQHQLKIADITLLANTTRDVRRSLEYFLRASSRGVLDDRVLTVSLLQGQMCYLEAGLYWVSGLDVSFDRFFQGDRKPIDFVGKGHFVYDEILPDAIYNEKIAYAIAHDRSMTSIFDHAELGMRFLELSSACAVRAQPLHCQQTLAFLPYGKSQEIWLKVEEIMSLQTQTWQERLKRGMTRDENQEIELTQSFRFAKKDMLLGSLTTSTFSSRRSFINQSVYSCYQWFCHVFSLTFCLCESWKSKSYQVSEFDLAAVETEGLARVHLEMCPEVLEDRALHCTKRRFAPGAL